MSTLFTLTVTDNGKETKAAEVSAGFAGADDCTAAGAVAGRCGDERDDV